MTKSSNWTPLVYPHDYPDGTSGKQPICNAADIRNMGSIPGLGRSLGGGSICSKSGKLSSGHRTGKGQFSCQSQRKAVPKNVQTTTQLHSSHTIAK